MNSFRLRSIFGLAVSISLASGVLNVAQSAEQWDCALDLKQGDTGSLSMTRNNNAVTGNINITRSSGSIEQEVEGRWLDRDIELTRFVNANSNQKMHGIAVKVGAQQVKIGGRYGDGLSGVWSADCDLLSGTSTGANTPQATAEQVLPSTSTQVTPYRPSNKDQIKFAAQATHPDGIESVAFFLGDKQIHACASDSCSFTYGRLRPGNYQWHVIATSKGGVKNVKRANQLLVGGSESAGVCTITGLATGAAVAQSAAVMLELAGDDGRQATRFDAGVYSFTKLEPGSYTLSIKLPESSGVLVSPSTQSINCDSGQVVQQNFEFR